MSAGLKSVLFVCTGNTCRSPMAEHLLKKMLKDKGAEGVTVVSAGIAPAAWIPFPPEASAALADYGVKNVSHAAQPVTAELVKSADLILAMEDGHRQALLRRHPEAKDKIFLLNEYAGLGGRGIPDPYGQPAGVYRDTLASIKKALDAMFDKLT